MDELSDDDLFSKESYYEPEMRQKIVDHINRITLLDNEQQTEHLKEIFNGVCFYNASPIMPEVHDLLIILEKHNFTFYCKHIDTNKPPELKIDNLVLCIIEFKDEHEQAMSNLFRDIQNFIKNNFVYPIFYVNHNLSKKYRFYYLTTAKGVN